MEGYYSFTPYWHQIHKGWHARVMHQGKIINLGYLPTEEEAWQAIEKMEVAYFGKVVTKSKSMARSSDWIVPVGESS